MTDPQIIDISKSFQDNLFENIHSVENAYLEVSKWVRDYLDPQWPGYDVENADVGKRGNRYTDLSKRLQEVSHRFQSDAKDGRSQNAHLAQTLSTGFDFLSEAVKDSKKNGQVLNSYYWLSMASENLDHVSDHIEGKDPHKHELVAFHEEEHVGSHISPISSEETIINGENKGLHPNEVHEVEKGETLSSLASKYYGNDHLWNKIFQTNQNHIKSPDLIFVGQKIEIPRLN